MFLILEEEADKGREMYSTNYRKVIFPHTEYISFLDVAVVTAKIGHAVDLKHLNFDGEVATENIDWIRCCISRKKISDPEAYLRDVYKAAIIDKVKCYQLVAGVLKEKVKSYKERVKNSRHTVKNGRLFELKWVKREVADLSYVLIHG